MKSDKIESFLKEKISGKSINGFNLNSINEETRESKFYMKYDEKFCINLQFYSDTRDIILLMNLHQFLLSPNKCGGKTCRKFSVEDSLGAFAIFGKSNEEIEDK